MSPEDAPTAPTPRGASAPNAVLGSKRCAASAARLPKSIRSIALDPLRKTRDSSLSTVPMAARRTEVRRTGEPMEALIGEAESAWCIDFMGGSVGVGSASGLWMFWRCHLRIYAAYFCGIIIVAQYIDACLLNCAEESVRRRNLRTRHGVARVGAPTETSTTLQGSIAPVIVNRPL